MAQALAHGDAALRRNGAWRDRQGQRRAGQVAAVCEGDAQRLRPRAAGRDRDLKGAVAAVTHREARPARQPAGALWQRERRGGLGAA